MRAKCDRINSQIAGSPLTDRVFYCYLNAAVHCYLDIDLRYIAPANLFKYLLLRGHNAVELVWIVW